MNKLLIIGGASFDTLHLQNETANTVGGAGMYTALAAARCGADVSIFGPRPEPCPEPLQPVAARLSEWLGPAISPAELPQFEISYYQGETEYIKVELDAEKMLTPALLPADLSEYDLVHITPIGDAQGQLPFVQACRQRGAKLISAGTGLFIAAEKPQTVRAVVEQSDYFFMNEQEATAVFGSLEAAGTAPGKLLYITLGARGACIIQGDTSTCIAAVPTGTLDPTGAGDTFCGAALAYLLRKEHPIMAARGAAALAAEMITQVGPTALLSTDPAPQILLDPRVKVNEAQVCEIAAQIAALPEAVPFPFISRELPPENHPQTIDYFFAATLQQFSFWSTKNGRYHLPLIATLGGTRLKGSDYLWQAYLQAIKLDPAFCSPDRQAKLSRADMLQLYRADDGTDPMPALDLHWQQAKQYGRDMLALGLTPQVILDHALASPEPLQTFIDLLDQIGGYKEDPFRKKSSLLAMILNQRPEHFLPFREDEEIAPVVDYHALRSSLRMGLVDIVDDELAVKIQKRQIVAPGQEWAVRFAVYRAIEQLAALSGKSMGAVDWFLFSARHYCPEMSEPQCERCLVDPICAHRKELFQPVIRTTFY